MLKSIFVLGLVFIYSCGSCIQSAEEFRQKRNYFQVEKKYTRGGRYYTLTGNGIDNKPDTFSESGFGEMYESVGVGDTLLKELGKTQVVLIKKDSSLVYPYSCDGKIIE